MKYRDYYEVLGASRTASQDEIQRAFRKLARKYHPDVNKEKGAEDRFKELNEANEVLSDPKKRKLYDSLGANWKAGQDFRPPPDFGQSSGGAHFNFGNGGGFSDFFEAMFGGSFEQFAQQQSAAGMHHFGGGFGGAPEVQEAEISLVLEDVYRGAKKNISLEAVEIDARGQAQRRVKTLEVKIPPGTTSGSVIRLPAQVGSSGKSSADVLLRVSIVPHPRFLVTGFDLVIQVPITPWEAALGAKVNVKGVDNEVKLTIPPGSQSGQKMRLKGMGLRESAHKRGDMYAQLQVVVPPSLTVAEKELYQKLSEISKFSPRG